jgi:hypothetical protein
MIAGKSLKLILAALAICLLVPVHFLQQELNRDRARLGLTRVTPLENAPPLLAFTTVALGGFRGLIANALWMRAIDLQDEGKYFEMVQLADWITKLQPTFASVWVHQAWNLTYNISIKFRDPAERWRWVLSGIELLRDRGLRYNPKEASIYRELAWFFQHKIGFFLDEAHMYYKEAWAAEMKKVFGPGRPNYEELIDPKTDDQKARAKLLREHFKMDPRLMKTVDETYGPLEWRLPESHALYWAMLGLKLAKKDDLIILRRVVFHSMDMAFKRGRLIENPFDHTFEFGPNLDIAEKTNQAYEDMMTQEPESRDQITTGHRNFLRNAVYFFYTHNRLTEANRWFRMLQEKYPDKPLLGGDPETIPGKISIEHYAITRFSEELFDTSTDTVKTMLMGLLRKSFFYRAIGEDDQADGYTLLAQQAWKDFQAKTPDDQMKRMGLPSWQTLRQSVLDEILNPPPDVPAPILEMVARLRARLGLPATNNTPTSAPKP